MIGRSRYHEENPAKTRPLVMSKHRWDHLYRGKQIYEYIYIYVNNIYLSTSNGYFFSGSTDAFQFSRTCYCHGRTVIFAIRVDLRKKCDNRLSAICA